MTDLTGRLGDTRTLLTVTNADSDSDDSDPNDIHFKPLEDRKNFKLEVSVPSLELLRHERRMKHEDYKKLDKMKNVSQ